MLIAPTRQGNVVIDVPNFNILFNKPNRNIGIKISGGADSAILAYMVALYVKESRPELSVSAITAIHPLKPYQGEFSKKVVRKIEELLDFKFKEHYIKELPNTEDYSKEQNDFVSELYNKQLIDMHFMGMTLNPPREDVEKFPDPDMPPERYEPDALWENHISARPFRNSHKRSIYDLYVHFGVLDELFPVTRSCEQITTDFTSHCKNCAFCFERRWGFGRYV